MTSTWGWLRSTKEKDIGVMFSRLAQEEFKHKYNIEKEYDSVILTEM